MSSPVRKKFKSTENETEYWKERYLAINGKFEALEQKYQSLSENHQKLNEDYQRLNEKYQQLASCHLCIEKKDPAENFNQSVALPDDKKCMDPFEKLPEPFVNEMLKYLTKDELLNAMEVSKSWSDFINVRNAPMNRLIFKLTSKELEDPNDLSIIDRIVTSSERRNYKHMKSPVVLQMKIEKLINPIPLYASTLETLEVTVDSIHGNGVVSLFPINFPKLRKLTYSLDDNSNFLAASSFPSLTHLKLYSGTDEEFSDYEPPRGFVQKLLQRLPKLQLLIVNFYEYYDGDLIESSELLKLSKSKKPSIKSMFINDYFPNFMKAYGSTLEHFETYELHTKQLMLLLQDLRGLKSLKIDGLRRSRDANKRRSKPETFKCNKSIEIVKIYWTHEVNDETFQKILLALPSLKILRWPVIEPHDLKFIAANMRHLKKLKCEINDELQQTYQEIQANPHLYVNTTFELVEQLQESESYNIQKEFDR